VHRCSCWRTVASAGEDLRQSPSFFRAFTLFSKTHHPDFREQLERWWRNRQSSYLDANVPDLPLGARVRKQRGAVNGCTSRVPQASGSPRIQHTVRRSPEDDGPGSGFGIRFARLRLINCPGRSIGDANVGLNRFSHSGSRFRPVIGIVSGNWHSLLSLRDP
jgi:hypothetical protein